MNKSGVTESLWRGLGDEMYRRIGLSAYRRDKAHTRERRHADNGSALLLVLFTIMLLTGLITGAVEFLKNDVDEYGARSKEFRARQLAQSGLAYGSVPVVQNADRGLLEQQMNDGGSFRVVISSESTKLNIKLTWQPKRRPAT